MPAKAVAKGLGILDSNATGGQTDRGARRKSPMHERSQVLLLYCDVDYDGNDDLLVHT